MMQIYLLNYDYEELYMGIEKKNNRIDIRLSDSVMAKLKALCSAEGRTMTAQIEEMIKNEWKNLKNP